MHKRVTQIVVLIAVLLVSAIAVWFQYGQNLSFQTSVLDQYGYGYVGDRDASELMANSPLSRRDADGVIELNYVVDMGEMVVVDGLQISNYVPSLHTEVLWVNESAPAMNVTVDDMNAVRTRFIAPYMEGEVILLLKVIGTRDDQPVARYVFRVRGALEQRADADDDLSLTFQDLLSLLQHWDEYGAEATGVLSVILSRYE